MAGYSAPTANIKVLEELLTVRNSIASMLGSASGWAQYQVMVLPNIRDVWCSCQLSDIAWCGKLLQIEQASTLAQDPTAVVTFLQSLLEATRPAAAAQLRRLQQLRSELGHGNATIEAWDLPFYLAQVGFTCFCLQADKPDRWEHVRSRSPL